MKQYYNKDTKTLDIPVQFAFDNGNRQWNPLETDVKVIKLKVPEAIQKAIEENSVDDSAARLSIEEAKKADKAAKDALAEAQKDGLITPAEHQALEAAKAKAAATKAAAKAKVDALPDAVKGDLPAELAKLTGIEVSPVNDADANGINDETDAAKQAATVSMEEAKKADKAAKDALAEAQKEGLITSAEHQAKAKDEVLPNTGKETANGALFGGLFTALGSMFLFRRRRNHNDNK